MPPPPQAHIGPSGPSRRGRTCLSPREASWPQADRWDPGCRGPPFPSLCLCPPWAGGLLFLAPSGGGGTEGQSGAPARAASPLSGCPLCAGRGGSVGRQRGVQNRGSVPTLGGSWRGGPPAGQAHGHTAGGGVCGRGSPGGMPSATRHAMLLGRASWATGRRAGLLSGDSGQGSPLQAGP